MVLKYLDLVLLASLIFLVIKMRMLIVVKFMCWMSCWFGCFLTHAVQCLLLLNVMHELNLVYSLHMYVHREYYKNKLIRAISMLMTSNEAKLELYLWPTIIYGHQSDLSLNILILMCIASILMFWKYVASLQWLHTIEVNILTKGLTSTDHNCWFRRS